MKLVVSFDTEAMQFLDETKNQVFNWMTGQTAADLEDGKPVIKFRKIDGQYGIVRLGDWVIENSEPGTYYALNDADFKRLFTGSNRNAWVDPVALTSVNEDYDQGWRDAIAECKRLNS